MVTPAQVRPWAWAALAASGVCLAGGWWLGWLELAIPGGAVAAVFAAGSLATLGGPSLAVSLRSAHRRVEIDGDPGVQLQVSNQGRRKARGRGLVVPVGERLVPVRLAPLAPGASAVASVAVPTDRRGLVRVGPVQAVRGDAFGMVARTWCWGAPLEVAVHPRTVAVPTGLPGLVRDVDGSPTGHPAEADMSFHALREYQHGDDVRTIHWRSSARLGRLVVRQSEDTRRARMALVVSTSGREYGCPRDFELAVSVYASVGLAQLNQSGDVTVVAAGAARRFVHAGRGALLDQAAAVGLGDSDRRSLTAAAAQSRREVPGATVAVLVTGAGLSDRDLRRVAGLLPLGASVVALRCRLGADLSVGRSGRVGWAHIGRLEDLRRAIRRLGGPC
ncbi:MAG: DUF58 domain-containing protein [Bifidobacteriaceae bacterium]|jgi:uncharacterized protein (DUF58 family)|nr:DUF58 domain-containing protein [Bifidobacteriaceae bacterium]